jgi:hypothetical protein
MSPVGCFLHNILLSCCSSKDIGVSTMLVPTIFVTVGKFLQQFIKKKKCFSRARVSKLNFVYNELSLHGFIVLNLINY